ncbi:hypothetical protein D0Z07_5692 [Hyphodiscus hymeniophilus]|uniref:ubiquitinyl hydrolase 1 n=1 Tax=Hyphodiscus hymeniophilus TaxID=353542 RepID=A0A9P6VHR9_9HELO|nr:hypothetical protein D0Z07_5692 [Hyphodiscus hymeniophilus]
MDAKSAGTQTTIWETLVHHVCLPPRLPGRQESRLDKIDQALNERLQDTAQAMRDLTDGLLRDDWDRVRRILLSCKLINASGRLTKSSLLIAFRSLHDGDALILHIAEQNASLNIRRYQNNGNDHVLFEAFEASPLSEDVLASKSALEWDFPGCAVAVPLSEFSKDSFQTELAIFLEKASTESIKRFAARTSKAGSFVFESRDTVDPSLITQMLMTILEANKGTRIFPPLLRKRIRDDVCWGEGGEKPWRRSPFYLTMRIGIERRLMMQNGSDGRVHYKFFLCLMISRLIDESLLYLHPELLNFLRIKLCRRLVKLEVDRERAASASQIIYDHYFTKLRQSFSKSAKAATERINLVWSNFKQSVSRPVFHLPRYAKPHFMVLTLPNSSRYIQDVLGQSLRSTASARPFAPNQLPQDYHASAAAADKKRAFAFRYFTLSGLETETRDRLVSYQELPPVSNLEHAERCKNIAGVIESYIETVSDAYTSNPEAKSMMLLTVMDLWVCMDESATKVFGPLKEYHPGFSADILNVLQLSRFDDFSRLHRINEYLQTRHAVSKSKATIFDDPVKGCFAGAYFDSSIRLQQLHKHIEAEAELARAAKEQEWKTRTLEYENLIASIAQATCLYNENHLQVRTHDDQRCSKCYLQRKSYRFKMTVHEHPLPSDLMQAKAVVFELAPPPAFAAYRDATFKIISLLGSPTYVEGVAPKMVLGDYEILNPYMASTRPRLSLASTTKSFLKTHYASPRFPVGLEDVCLRNGLKLSYYDSGQKVWLRQIEKPKFSHHVRMTIPFNSPFSIFNRSPEKFDGTSDGPTSYEVISSQTECPAGVNVHEYMAYQTLLSGKNRRWHQLLVELGASNINFSTEVTTILMSVMALQVGPSCESALGQVHQVFRDVGFCERLAEQVDHRLEAISSNWRETNCMETMITLIIKLKSFGLNADEKANNLLEKARSICLKWMAGLRSELQTATDPQIIQRCTTNCLLATLLCRRTFVMCIDDGHLPPSLLRSFIECSIIFQHTLPADPASLPILWRNALVRDLKAVYQIRHLLRQSLKDNPDILPLAIASVWEGLKKGSLDAALRFEFITEPGSDENWWVQIVVHASKDTTQQTVHLHLLEGILLVNGQSIGKLPPQHRASVVLQRLLYVSQYSASNWEVSTIVLSDDMNSFVLTVNADVEFASGDQVLLTSPSDLPGMTYMLPNPFQGHQIHIGFRNGDLIVRARFRDALLELIPSQVFGTSHNFDLPGALIMDCAHWLNLHNGVIDIRQQPITRQGAGSAPSLKINWIFKWKPKEGNWKLDFYARRAHRRTSTLIDPQSRLFQSVAKIFDRFEYARFLTVYQPATKPLMVELKRLELQFVVNRRNLLESRQLRSEIDINQDIGTWYGLDSKIVLRAVAQNRDAVVQRQRSVIVPIGALMYNVAGPHVRVQVENNGLYARFTVNETLGRLDCPAEPRLLYLKAQFHAYTSFILPDTLTGRTGTEEALHCLKSGYCQPWTPLVEYHWSILASIAKLTPRRDYYPMNMKVMQKVSWDPQLTSSIQHDYFRTVVQEIHDKSEQLSAFSIPKPETPRLDTAGANHLVLRSHLRRQAYQRPNVVFDEQQTPPDHVYKARDRLRTSQGRANVIECIKTIQQWPTDIHTTSDLAGIFQDWATIGGYQGFFEKFLLTDLLSVDFVADFGSLVNLCRCCSAEDSHRLMFLFALMSFRHDESMEILRTLLAFAIFEDLKVVAPPRWLSFTQFRYRQTPRIEYLSQLIKPSYIPYGEDARSIFLNLNAKQRRKLAATEALYEQQQEDDTRILAQHLLEQWPCLKPSLDGFTSSVLVDTAKALELIHPEWERLFQNWELSHYLGEVQKVLDSHQAEPGTESGSTESREQEVIATRCRGGEFPTLQDLLGKSGPVAMDPLPFQSPFLKNINSVPATPKVANENKVPDGRLMKALQANKSYHPLFREIRELQGIIGNLAGTKSVVRKEYGNDLTNSLRALQKTDVGSKKEYERLDLTRISDQIAQAQLEIQRSFGTICKALQLNDRRANWLQSCGLWPTVTPIGLLENLRTTSTCVFGNRVKESLIRYALEITRLQRLLRMEDALQLENMQRLHSEQDNPGHQNWKPTEQCDWLLLEIDSNLLIRPTQIDVAHAMISPMSSSNSAIQLNMGQGKTSCIMPMASAVLANGKSLMRIVVPKALLLQTAQLLHGRLGGLLGREIRHIPFSRKTSTQPDIIRSFFEIHKNIRKTSGVILGVPEHLLSFMLSGQQRLSDGLIPEAHIMISVQNWMIRHSRTILDECDYTLSMRTQLIYPSGSQKTVDGHPHRWETIEALLQKVDGHLWHLQEQFPRSIEIIRRLRATSGSQAALPTGFPVVYFLRKDVEDALLGRLVDDIYQRRIPILPACKKSDRIAIRTFISEAKVSPGIAHQIADMFPDKPAAKQTLHLLRGLLVHRILLMTLKKRWNVQYGLHPTRDPISVPYHAKGTPSENAEWGHPDVSILFTVLAFYYDGLNPIQLRQSLEHVLKSDEPSHIYDRFTQDSTLPDSLKDWNAINVDDEAQLNEIHIHVRYNMGVIDYFLNNFVFPKHAKQFQLKIQSSGWDIPHFAPGSQPLPGIETLTTGFSGTNDWKHMLPLTIRQHDLNGLVHTNAEVLTYLLQPRSQQVVIAADHHGRHLTEWELLKRISDMSIRVLLDAGAQIQEMDNFTLVKTWLEIFVDAPAAVYFDQGNKACVLYRHGKRMPLLATPFAEDLGECLVYLDEAHTRGVDLAFRTSTKGALTLGLNQTKDHTVQAAMRLRQLASTQSVAFFAPPEVYHSILDFRNKQLGNVINSSDVISWLLEQTCNGIEQLKPLWFSQGTDFCRRIQASLDNPDFVQDSDQRETYLQSLRQVEQQTLEKLYGVGVNVKSSVGNGTSCPEVEVFMKELNRQRRGFQDTGDAVHASALQEVEQEREVAYEVEVVRVLQKPVHHQALSFPGLHKDIVNFVKTGRLAVDPSGYEVAVNSLRRTKLGRKYGVGSQGTSGKLFISTEFTRTVQLPLGRLYDNFQRHVSWILWSTVAQAALIVIPEEAEHILSLINDIESPPTHILNYAAPVTRKMLHFNDFRYYAVPRLHPDWEAPPWLKIELGIFAGRLYFEFSEYLLLCEYLGLGENDTKSENVEVEDFGLDGVGEIDEEAEVMEEPSTENNSKVFCKKPLMFLQEFLALRRKGQDFSHTPMGYLCQGKPLLESHPFFAQPVLGPKKEVQHVQREGRVQDVTEDDMEDENMFDDDGYGDDVCAEDANNFDDSQLLAESGSDES